MCVFFHRRGPQRPWRRRRGVTLLELVIVVAILAVLGAMIVPSLSRSVDSSRDAISRGALVQLRTVILDTYYHDHFEQLPYFAGYTQLRSLYVNPNPAQLYDPVTRRGWRGPYLLSPPNGAGYVLAPSRGFTALYGQDGDPAPLDGWGHPIVLQQPILFCGVISPSDLANARLVSAGPNGVIDTPHGVAAPATTQIGDDLVIRLGGEP